MPWKECSMMDEKIKFIAMLLDGEKLAPLCREFNISRKTGYQIWKKYLQFGQQAFIEQKRTPYRYANKLPVVLSGLDRHKPWDSLSQKSVRILS
ncbi:MAG: helix-turn-helix domain-containing protein [Bdellovibrionales bacterium]